MKLIDSILEFVFPNRCPCCGEINVTNEPCEKCGSDLNSCRFEGRICKKCGNEALLCECSKYNYLFNGVCAPFKNIGIARDGIYGLKFLDRPYSADYFGKEIAARFTEVFKEVKPDFVCIVPSSKRTLLKRNYDYVELLAKRVAKELGIPLESKTIKKVKQNEQQHKLSTDKRMSNVKGVFAVKENLIGKTILLIDDIKTTGYTLNECAKQLRLSGAENVYCAVALISLINTCNKKKHKI